MNIGIDIDDTLTDIRDELKLAAEKYANKLGKEIKDNRYAEDQNNGNIYQIKYSLLYDIFTKKRKREKMKYEFNQ